MPLPSKVVIITLQTLYSLSFVLLVCGIAVLDDFSCGISVILILNCGIAIFSKPAGCGFLAFWPV